MVNKKLNVKEGSGNGKISPLRPRWGTWRGVLLPTTLRDIHTEHAVPMPRPSRSPAIPCRQRFRLCLSHLVYAVLPHPCRAPTMPFWRRLLKATAQHSMGVAWARYGLDELASAVERRPVGDLPAFGFFRLPSEVPRSLLSEAYQSQMQVASVKPNNVCHGRGKTYNFSARTWVLVQFTAQRS